MFNKSVAAHAKTSRNPRDPSLPLTHRAEDNIVLILLEDVHARNRTPHLNYLLTTKTYIAWPRRDGPGVARQRRRFWTLLKKVLKPTPHAVYDENPRDFVIQR